MSTPRFTAEELDRLRALAAEWGKIVSKRAFGEDGPGLDVDFRTMEQIATAAAQGLTEGALQQMLQQQAQKVPDESPCPVCGERCPTRTHTRALARKGPRFNRPNGSPTVPPADGTFSLRATLGLDEHAFSSSVIQPHRHGRRTVLLVP
ncbi:hypothetical protein [Frigoriglobus tundricola]|uniref:Uncharacterized protein n=1 Tax=Frigoriglobus tundricola TaxID=2774151 RepID=A0A6M5YZ65_9BACT|nr:hypothetical protein [Frigoriglobus tundricola]QJW99148.1 hypothetical protein FTUN_6748 [Frigoriglobus tundricola]